MERHRGKNNHKCAGYWLIDSSNVGQCLKLYPDKDLIGCVCGDTGKPCPYGGERDFGRLQRKPESLREQEWKASLGGRQNHGLE